MKKIFVSFLVLAIPFSSIVYALENEKNYLEKAQKTSKELLGSLKKQLTNALENKDTVQAVVVCSSIAQDIAKNISDNNNLNIKRVSLKNRNINGKPDEFETKNLELFDKLNLEKKITPEYDTYSIVEEKDNKYFRYMKPIITAKSCLQCHGEKETIKEAVKKVLFEKYPKDTAFGYKEGDIRGAVSVKIKLM
ncbi:MAG: DUF3365 domain-containing protein [Candidatus Sericytochromatia bacterium]